MATPGVTAILKDGEPKELVDLVDTKNTDFVMPEGYILRTYDSVSECISDLTSEGIDYTEDYKLVFVPIES